MANDLPKNRSLFGLYWGLLISLAAAVGFGYVNFHSISAGRFSEVGGLGGAVIGTVTASGDPLKFWGFIFITSFCSGASVIMLAGRIIGEHRRRRRRAR